MKKFNLIMAGIVTTSVIAPMTAFAGDVTVKSGDTLSELAVKHNMSVSELKSMNGLKTNVIRIGQKLKVKGSSVNTSAGIVQNCTYLNVRASADKTSQIKAILKAGMKVEILGTKGTFYHVKVNGVTGYASTKYIKSSKSVAPVSSPVKKPDKAVSGSMYTVVRGDTLSEIAKKFKTTVAKIKAENGMKTDVIRIGQKLKVQTGKIQADSKKIFQRPTVTSRVTSARGPRSIGYHFGIDYALPGNQKIMAAADGVVSKSYKDKLWGEVVFIKHVIGGKTYETIYAHMRENSRVVKVGDRVKTGQFIGWMGSTGNSTGQHLHFEVHPGGYVSQAKTSVDPAPYIK